MSDIARRGRRQSSEGVDRYVAKYIVLVAINQATAATKTTPGVVDLSWLAADDALKEPQLSSSRPEQAAELRLEHTEVAEVPRSASVGCMVTPPPPGTTIVTP